MDKEPSDAEMASASKILDTAVAQATVSSPEASVDTGAASSTRIDVVGILAGFAIVVALIWTSGKATQHPGVAPQIQTHL